MLHKCEMTQTILCSSKRITNSLNESICILKSGCPTVLPFCIQRPVHSGGINGRGVAQRRAAPRVNKVKTTRSEAMCRLVTFMTTMSRCLENPAVAAWCITSLNYFHRRLASDESIVTFGVTLSRCRTVCVCVCVPRCLHHVSNARRIHLGGEGNALYPMLSSLFFDLI